MTRAANGIDSAPGRLRAVPLLSCRGLSKRYGSIRAVSELDFDGHAGEVHTLIGENGAGKSTFIKMLAGAVRPDTGTITLDGRAVELGGPRDAFGHGMAFVFQELSLAPDLTVGQNLWLDSAPTSRLGTLRRPTLRRLTFEHFERLGCEPVDPDRKVRELDLAERQLVEIVRALARQPRILVLDEATASLAARETEWLLRTTRRLAADGALVLFISHRLREVREVADRATVLRSGRSILTAPLRELDDDQVVEAMLGRKPQRLYPPPLKPPRAEVALRLDGVSVGAAVDDVSFELRKGEVLGVGGLQGHGQSELLLGLFGVLPTSGVVEVDGRRARLRSPRAALRSGLGLALVPEDRKQEGLLLDKPIRHNLSLAVLNRISRAGLMLRGPEERLAADGMQRLNIRAESADQLAGTLSGGNQQKVVIAKLLAVGAKILLFHDLTRGVDVGTKAEIFALARELAADGYAILMYSSDNEELIHMSDRLLVLRQGKVAAVLEGDSLTEPAIMQAALALGEGEGS